MCIEHGEEPPLSKELIQSGGGQPVLPEMLLFIKQELSFTLTGTAKPVSIGCKKSPVYSA
jgi:hypothetical protein